MEKEVYKNFILMRIIDHAHARDCMIKSVAEIYKGEKHLLQTSNSIF